MKRNHLVCAAVAGTLVCSSGLHAETIKFDTTLAAVCTLVVTDGALAPNTDYTSLSSENLGGSAASITVTALGGNPTLAFAAPTITSSEDVSSVTPQIKYTSLDGASQDYTSASSTSNSSDLADVYVVNAKAESISGFDAGDYSIATVVTCSG